MTARRSLASDISGLTKKPPLSRRDFMSASAAIAAGYTLAAGPVRAEAIKTDTNDLDAGMSNVKVDGGERASGVFMPMVASDGPHYGDNVKLAGVGKYKLTMVVNAPGTLQEFGCKMGGAPAAGAHAAHGGMGPWCFGRHVDKETGVGPWFKPITKEVDFTFSGIGKKGGY